MEELRIKVDGSPILLNDVVEDLDVRGDGPNFPNDLIVEILARSPAKSVLRCKCVSKSWHNLIKEPTFIDKHAVERKKNGKKMLMMRCYFQENHNELSFHDLDSLELQQPNLSIPEWDSSCTHPRILGESYILGPCKGIVCIRDWNTFDVIPSHYTFKCAERIILCNPTLREFKLLPSCYFEPLHKWLDYVSGIGFGHSSTNVFKVVLVRFCHLSGMRPVNDESSDESDEDTDSDDEEEDEDYYDELPPYVVVHLYNTRTHSWRRIDYHGMVHPRGSESNIGLFFNSACHWHAATSLNHSLPHHSSPFVVLSFDMNNDVFKQLEYPDCVRNHDAPWNQLVVIDECLSLVQPQHTRKETDSHRIDIWVMKEYGVKSSWVKQFVVRLEEVMIFPSVWDGKEYNKAHLRFLGRRMACIELITGKSTKFRIYWKGTQTRTSLHEESLLSLDHLIKYP